MGERREGRKKEVFVRLLALLLVTMTGPSAETSFVPAIWGSTAATKACGPALELATAKGARDSTGAALQGQRRGGEGRSAACQEQGCGKRAMLRVLGVPWAQAIMGLAATAGPVPRRQLRQTSDNAQKMTRDVRTEADGDSASFAAAGTSRDAAGARKSEPGRGRSAAGVYEERQTAKQASQARGRIESRGNGDGFVSRAELARRAHRLARNGTIIVLVCNAGARDFLLNWVRYAEALGLDRHFLAFAEDEKCYEFVEARWPGQAVRMHVVEMEGPDQTQHIAGLGELRRDKSSATSYDSAEFKLIMYRRMMYLRALLATGLNVLSCDVDIVLLQDPFPFLLQGPQYDLTGPMDPLDHALPRQSRTTDPVNPDGLMMVCMGFVLFRSSPWGALLMDQVIHMILRYEGDTRFKNDQMYMRDLLRQLWCSHHGLCLREDEGPHPAVGILPQLHFPPGWLFFGSRKWRQRNRSQVVAVHNNWIHSNACKLLRWILVDLWRIADQWAPQGRRAHGVPLDADLEWSTRLDLGGLRLLDKGTVSGALRIAWRRQGVPKGALPSDLEKCAGVEGDPRKRGRIEAARRRKLKARKKREMTNQARAQKA